jgi:hypothetical protein
MATAKSVGFVARDIHTGGVVSPLFKRRDQARDFIAAYYGGERFSVQEIRARGLRVLGIDQVKLYPGETFNPSARR